MLRLFITIFTFVTTFQAHAQSARFLNTDNYVEPNAHTVSSIVENNIGNISAGTAGLLAIGGGQYLFRRERLERGLAKAAEGAPLATSTYQDRIPIDKLNEFLQARDTAIQQAVAAHGKLDPNEIGEVKIKLQMLTDGVVTNSNELTVQEFNSLMERSPDLQIGEIRVANGPLQKGALARANSKGTAGLMLNFAGGVTLFVTAFVTVVSSSHAKAASLPADAISAEQAAHVAVPHPASIDGAMINLPAY